MVVVCDCDKTGTCDANHDTTFVLSIADQGVGGTRHDLRWVPRSGKRLRAFFVAFGWDDPNDDETSDDPADDDDGWEGLSTVSESEAPVYAWFADVGSYQSDLELRPESVWSEPLLHTSFLKLVRLRC